MSRIGRKPIAIPSGVTVTIQNGEITVKGGKGEMKLDLAPNITVAVEENEIVVSQTGKAGGKQKRMNHGLMRSLLQNMVIGVSEGFTKKLKLVGTGYRVAKKGQGLTLTVGFSHPVDIDAVDGITFDTEGNDTIVISGMDKQLVGQMAADIRRVRPPEPYKGKGIRYDDEVVRRKQGKTVAG